MARQVAAQRLGLLDGKHRWMLDGALRDAELFQAEKSCCGLSIGILE
jgi:hypothetical protein